MPAVTLTPIHKEIAQALSDVGEFFFTSKQLMDCFGLAYTVEETRQAIDCMLSFNKWLTSLGCELHQVGFRELDRASLRFAFTYTVQSNEHMNDPLLVNEVFTLQVPLLALANELPSMWVQVYQKRPSQDILRIAEGH